MKNEKIWKNEVESRKGINRWSLSLILFILVGAGPWVQVQRMVDAPEPLSLGGLPVATVRVQLSPAKKLI